MAQNNQEIFFAGGYSTADQPGIQALAFDSTSGAITQVGTFSGINSPSFLLVHPNGQWLYAVSETGVGSHGQQGSVWALKYQVEPFSVTALNHQSSGGDWPCHLQLDKTGKWLFTANYGSGNASVYPVLEDGSLGPASDFVQHTGSGPNPARQEGPHAHSVTLTPDNKFALVADLGLDQVVIYAFDSQTGKLTRAGEIQTQPGAGPRHLTFHPSGRVLYVANEVDNTVNAYTYDDTTSAFTFKQTLSTLPANAPASTVADIHLNADATRLYVSNRGYDSLAVYEVDKEGFLTRLAIPSCGGKVPRNFAIAPNGRFILVANQESDAVVVLPLLLGAEEIGPAVAKADVHKASSIQFLPAHA